MLKSMLLMKQRKTAKDDVTEIDTEKAENEESDKNGETTDR